jgi:hypothetical protein
MLEKIIEENKNRPSLSLILTRITDQDAEIVAYYAIRDNEVSKSALF